MGQMNPLRPARLALLWLLAGVPLERHNAAIDHIQQQHQMRLGQPPPPAGAAAVTRRGAARVLLESARDARRKTLAALREALAEHRAIRGSAGRMPPAGRAAQDARPAALSDGYRADHDLPTQRTRPAPPPR